MIMSKAKLLPLKGKYYGTKVELPWGQEVTFWLTFADREDRKGYIPSDRELEAENITREQWNNNEVVEYNNMFGGVSFSHAKDVVVACDHFEDQHSYEVALAFVEMYNEKFREGKGL